MNISVVIPLLNEEESLNELHDWIVKVMQSNSYSYEILFVDDGSTDNSWKIIEDFKSIFEVKYETTLNASYRLTIIDNIDNCVCLNFASTKKVLYLSHTQRL